jgi:ComF family protein
MLFSPKQYAANFLHLFYPHNCEGCGSDLLNDTHFLCARCLHRLPETRFFLSPANPVEKLFYGRLPVCEAAAAYYFTKDSLLQHLLVQLKYKGNKEAGYFLGRMMGHAIAKSSRFTDVDLVAPLPLHPRKEQMRGYNQAGLICEGISETWQRPVLQQVVSRIQFTETQTLRNRVDRAGNMEGAFSIPDPAPLRGKHILLVDDVITTGASLEACGSAILGVDGTSLSIAAAAYTV